MFSQHVQLVCALVAFTVFHSVGAQAVSTAIENGIVSAAGSPEPTPYISYTIEGAPAPSITRTHSSTGGSLAISGDSSNAASGNNNGLTVAAMVGIAVAVMLAVVSIVGVTVGVHKKRRQRQKAARVKRKSIMDTEFAAEGKTTVHHVDTTKVFTTTIGYFDIAKPLPVVIKPMDHDRLSRSSTIIGDAAEVAQINRKACKHQGKQKEQRAAMRGRNHALRILVANEDKHTSEHASSPSTLGPATPVDADCNPQGDCPDGNGDAFTKWPSKI